MNKAIRILLVDDSEVIRHGLRYMLAPEEGMDVAGDCDAEEASSKIARLCPDIVLTGMPGIIRSLKRNLDYGGDVIVLAESLDYRDEALEAGAARYLLKDVTDVELVEAIRQVYSRSLADKEAVELVIPPPDNAAQLFRFMCQLGQILHDNSASIVWAVFPRDREAVITIELQPDTFSSLLIALANMPEVEKVEEEPLAGGAFPCLPKRFWFLTKGISSSKRTRIILKETDTERTNFIPPKK